MAKPKSIASFKAQFRKALEARHGEYNEILYGLAVNKAAMDFHLLEMYMEQLESADFVVNTPGSMGQIKQEVNPLLAAYDKCSRTCQAALDALQLTPQSTFKKVEGTGGKKEEDPMAQYFSQL